jgi:sensor histidine kinase regulating citrate/malate metabolism
MPVKKVAWMLDILIEVPHEFIQSVQAITGLLQLGYE